MTGEKMKCRRQRRSAHSACANLMSRELHAFHLFVPHLFGIPLQPIKGRDWPDWVDDSYAAAFVFIACVCPSYESSVLLSSTTVSMWTGRLHNFHKFESVSFA